MNTGLSGTITILFLILIKVLFAAFVLGLIGGILLLIKDTLFSGIQKDTNKKICTKCDKELKPEWKACPHCGESI